MRFFISPRGAGYASVLSYAAAASPIYPLHMVAHLKGNQIGTTDPGLSLSLYDCPPSTFAADVSGSRTLLSDGVAKSVAPGGNLYVNSGLSSTWGRFIIGDNERIPFSFACRNVYFSGLTYDSQAMTLDGLTQEQYDAAVSTDGSDANLLPCVAKSFESQCGTGTKYGHYGLTMHRNWANEADIPDDYDSFDVTEGVGEANEESIPDYIMQETSVWFPRTYAIWNIGETTDKTGMSNGSVCTYQWTVKYARWMTWIASKMNEAHSVTRPIICVQWPNTVQNDLDTSAETHAAFAEGCRLGGASAYCLLCVEDNATIDATTAARVDLYKAGIRMVA